METDRIGNEEVVKKLPASLQRLMTFERFHLHKADTFRNTSIAPEFDTRYLPQNCSAVELPCYWVRRKDLYVYGLQSRDGSELNLFELDGMRERVLFPIHPLELDYYRQFLRDVRAKDAASEGLRVWAVPTSSTRTLLAWPERAPEKALFIKTSLHSRTFGDRHIYRSKVAGGVGLSKLVETSLPSLPSALRYLFEPVGFVPRRMQDSGVIIRSIPKEIMDGEAVIAPLFSLLGGRGDYQPLFLTILERSGMEAEQFIEDVLCAQFARLWLEMSMRFGLMLEAHGQDLMLGLSPDLTPLGRFYYRDFEGLAVDWQLRRARGLLERTYMPHAWAWYDTYETWGHPSYQLVSCKLRTSLFDYLHLVLNELDSQLRDWQSSGLLGGRKFEKDHVTMMFSQHMMKAIEEMFGVRAGAEYNIYYSLNRFVIFLMKLRRELAEVSESAFRPSAGAVVTRQADSSGLAICGHG